MDLAVLDRATVPREYVTSTNLAERQEGGWIITERVVHFIAHRGEKDVHTVELWRRTA